MFMFMFMFLFLFIFILFLFFTVMHGRRTLGLMGHLETDTRLRGPAAPPAGSPPILASKNTHQVAIVISGPYVALVKCKCDSCQYSAHAYTIAIGA
jgi:hypothetical protein